MRAIAILCLLAAILLCAGCGGLRDDESRRPAPTDPDKTLMADLQAKLDAGPLDGISR